MCVHDASPVFMSALCECLCTYACVLVYNNNIIIYCFYIANFITAVISMRFTNNYIHTQKIYNTITRIIKIKICQSSVQCK